MSDKRRVLVGGMDLCESRLEGDNGSSDGVCPVV